MHYDDPVFVVGVGVGAVVGVGVGAVVGVADDVVTVEVAAGVVTVGVAAGVVIVGLAVVELDNEADTLWSVSCQRPNAIMPMANVATRRNPYFCLVGLFVTLRVIIGVPRGGMPPDSIMTSPCGRAIHPSTIPLLSSAAVRNVLPGLRIRPCRT